MDSFDAHEFPFDFVKHIYNFAAVSDDLSGLVLDLPPPIRPAQPICPSQPSAAVSLSDLFAGLDSPVSSAASELLPEISPQELEKAFTPDSGSPSAAPDLPASAAPRALPSLPALPLPARATEPPQPGSGLPYFEPRALYPLAQLGRPAPVCIAPLAVAGAVAPAPAPGLAHAAQGAWDKAAEQQRAQELKRIREYNRKIRNRESAARSNLARKRRRELQRLEDAKKQKLRAQQTSLPHATLASA